MGREGRATEQGGDAKDSKGLDVDVRGLLGGVHSETVRDGLKRLSEELCMGRQALGAELPR